MLQMHFDLCDSFSIFVSTYTAPLHMTILFITSEYPPFTDDKSGLGTHSRTLALSLSRVGCEVVVLTYRDGPGVVALDDNVRIIVVGGAQTKHDTGNVSTYIQELNDHVATSSIRILGSLAIHPDIVHVQGPYGIYAAEILSKHFVCPLVGTVHLLYQGLFSAHGLTVHDHLLRLNTRLCSSVNTLIAVSDFMAREVNKLSLRPPHTIEIIHNGIDLTPIAHHPSRSHIISNGSSKRHILYVGRLVPQKGALFLLRSAEVVLSTVGDVVYLLVGSNYDTTYRAELDVFLDEHPQVKRSVVFAGPMSHEEMWGLYQHSYMVIVPSLYESFGLSALEAMTCGVPVIASAVGGLKEVIVNEHTGILVGPSTARSGIYIDHILLAQAQLRLLSDPELARRLGRNGALRAHSHFSEEIMVEKTLRCYQRLLATAVFGPRL